MRNRSVILLMIFAFHTQIISVKADCVDKDAVNCPYYAIQDHCKNYNSIGGILITDYCKKSCDRCPIEGTTESIPDDCFDIDPKYCPYYSNVGYCKSYLTIRGIPLNEYCAKSCKNCPINILTR